MMSNPGKVLRCVELNHTLRCLCGSRNSFGFSLAVVLPAGAYCVNSGTEVVAPTSIIVFGWDYRGYLILFAPGFISV